MWTLLDVLGYIYLKFLSSSLVKAQHYAPYINKISMEALKNIILIYLLSPESHIVEDLFITEHAIPILMFASFLYSVSMIPNI